MKQIILIGLEIPSMNGKHYALPIKSQQDLHGEVECCAFIRKSLEVTVIRI